MRTISKPVLLGGGAVLTAIIAFLAFGVFGIHTAFIDDEVSEANPFAVVAEVPADDSDASGADTDDATGGDAMDDDSSDSDSMSDDDAMEDDAMADEAMEDDAEPVVTTVTTGSFVSNSRYTTVGEGFTITDGNQVFLRFEEFETNNGPDLNVYLRNSEDPDDYIDLGDLKGNIGDQNYELPADIDLERYDFVDIWCVRFGVSFGSATLTTA